jgi:hypothetical protein
MSQDDFPTVPPLVTQQEWVQRTDRRRIPFGGRLDRSAELQAIDTALGEYDRSRNDYTRAVAGYAKLPPEQQATPAARSTVIAQLDTVVDNLGAVSRAVDAWGPSQHSSRNGRGAVTELVNALGSEHARTLRQQRDLLDPERAAHRAAALASLESGPPRPVRGRRAQVEPSGPQQAGPSGPQAGPSRPQETEPGVSPQNVGPGNIGPRSRWSAWSDVAQQSAAVPAEPRSEWYDDDSRHSSLSSEPPTPRAATELGTESRSPEGPQHRPTPSGVPPSEVSIPSSVGSFGHTRPDVPSSVVGSPTSTEESGVPLSTLFRSPTPSESSGERGPSRRDPSRRRSESEQHSGRSSSPGKGKGHGR